MSVLKEKKIRSVHIIINPASGTRASILSFLNDALKGKDIDWEISITKAAGDGTVLAKKAVEEKVDAVAAFGGDGTQMEVINGLLGSDVPLIILPGGSANVMATKLGVPKDLAEACRLMTETEVDVKTIDIGKLGRNHFLVGVSMGFEAEVIKNTNREAKNKFGILAYLMSGVSLLRKLKEVTYHITIDGQDYKVKGVNCIVCNAANMGFADIPLEKHIDVSDGLFDVLVLRKANLGLFKHFILTLLRKEPPENRELVEHWQGKDIKVSSRPLQRVQCDGEALNKEPVHIKVIPSIIRIIVPKQSPS